MKKILLLLTIFISSLTLFACEDQKIESNLIIVTFYTSPNGTLYDTLEIEKDTSIDEVADPTRNGYTFDGWFTDLLHTKPHSFVNTFPASTTLYAKWIPNVNTITYNLDGGQNSPLNPQTFLSGQSIILTQPTRFDSTFIGWYLIPQSQVNILVDRRINSTTGLVNDITLYALFERTQHVVQFNARGLGSFALPSSITILNPRTLRVPGGSEIPRLEILTRDGYAFEGWWDNTYTREFKTGDIYDLGRATTLFAKWTPLES
jgi:uncharacterized repeat protein (TIGR02543 family)